MVGEAGEVRKPTLASLLLALACSTVPQFLIITLTVVLGVPGGRIIELLAFSKVTRPGMFFVLFNSG